MKQKAPDFVKGLGPQQRKILQALIGGSILHRHFQSGSSNYWLEGHGEVSPDTVRSLLSRELIVEHSDGLFDVGMTYGITARAYAV